MFFFLLLNAQNGVNKNSEDLNLENIRKEEVHYNKHFKGSRTLLDSEEINLDKALLYNSNNEHSLYAEHQFYNAFIYNQQQNYKIADSILAEVIAIGIRDNLTSKNIQENIFLKRDLKIKSLEAIKEKKFRYVLFLLILLGIGLISDIWFRYKHNEKTAEVLAKKNKIIVNQKQDVTNMLYKVEKKNEELESVNATKEKLFSIIAHDLVNPFNSLLGYANLLNDDFEILSSTEKKHYIHIIKKSAFRNYNLVKTLLDWSKTQRKNISVNLSIITPYTIAQNTLNTYLSIANKKNITFKNNIVKSTTIFSDKSLLSTVINNIISNAIKYSHANGNIILSSNIKNKNFTIIIEDFGIGISSTRLSVISHKKPIISTSGTNNEKGTGLGISICKDFISLLKGEFHVSSIQNKGTKVSITIPLAIKLHVNESK